MALTPGLSAMEARDMREARWTQLLDDELRRREKSVSAVETEPLKSAAWKIGMATQLRRSGVPYPWLAQNLRMGSANSVRAYVNRYREELHISA